MRCLSLLAVAALAVLLTSCSTTRYVEGTVIRDTTITVTPPPVNVELPGSNDSSDMGSPTWTGQDSTARVQFTIDMADALSRMSKDLRAQYDSTLGLALARARGTFRVNLQPPQVEFRYRDTTVYRDREVPREPPAAEKIGWGAMGAVGSLVLMGMIFGAVKYLGRS
jgi:hypothetical protein